MIAASVGARLLQNQDRSLRELLQLASRLGTLGLVNQPRWPQLFKQFLPRVERVRRDVQQLPEASRR